MYNMDFYDQCEEARRHLFGFTGEPPSAVVSARYKPTCKCVPCHEDTNGEWVPDQDIFEDKP